VERYQRRAAVLRQHLRAPADAASQALGEEARKLGLERQRDYLHNAVGLGTEFLALSWLMARGNGWGPWHKPQGPGMPW
jgi:hypothetical protein